MNRATGTGTARSVDRILLANKPPPDPCECDQAIDLQRRIATARPFLESVIEKLAELASSPTSAAGMALVGCRQALSALDSGDE